MKYDIFISYSRADLQQVEPFVKMIEQRANVKCWIDWSGIESGSQFEDDIVRAIDSVEVVLFFISENSINSHYAKLEINYAYNVKKRVVPVILDGGNLRGWFLFKFGAVDFIDIRNQRQCDKLIQNLQEWCGTSAPVPTPRPTKTYRVGDYYNDGVREGVVFEVSADGRHGKIVSMMQSTEKIEWTSVEAQHNLLIGADSKTNGAYNMIKVRSIPDWRNKYPAFKWCSDLGDGWYLPSMEELQTMCRNREKLNRKLIEKINRVWYWSSTEDDWKNLNDEAVVWYVLMNNGYTSTRVKYNYGYVRAVSAF